MKGDKNLEWFQEISKHRQVLEQCCRFGDMTKIGNYTNNWHVVFVGFQKVCLNTVYQIECFHQQHEKSFCHLQHL